MSRRGRFLGALLPSVLTSLIATFCVTTPANAREKYIASEGRLGCASRVTYDKIYTYLALNDRAAFESGLRAGLLTGQCTLFQKSESVVIVDVAIIAGLTQIRRTGETAEFWTSISSVK